MKLDLVGQTFGRWLVLERASGSDWLCECLCPAKTQRKIQTWKLRSGHSKSCGCGAREATARRNSERQKRYEVYGEKLTVAELATLAGVSRELMESRIQRGISPEKAVTMRKFERPDENDIVLLPGVIERRDRIARLTKESKAKKVRQMEMRRQGENVTLRYRQGKTAGAWYVLIRGGGRVGVEMIRIPGLSSRDQRPAAEEFARPYREATVAAKHRCRMERATAMARTSSGVTETVTEASEPSQPET